MANEISISLSITASKNGAKFTRQESFKDDMTGDAWVAGVQQVGASSEALVTHADITTYGWVYLKNLDTGANYVEFSHDTASIGGDDSICRLFAGESCIFKTAPETAISAISSSGTQAVEYAIIEL
tara:strand:- start:17 stop:394 length:378 start_codon:yes stop_codon:yes gene_type:complete